MRVVVIGAGYVGANCAAAFAYLGHEIILIEKDARKLELLRAGTSPIHEHGLQDLLAMHPVQEGLHATDDLALALQGADAVLVAVGTPPRSNGQADTCYVEAAALAVARALPPGQRTTIIVKSTVPVGTNLRVRAVVSGELMARGVSCEVSYASNPEFLREGRALEDMMYPDRVVVGTDCDAAVDTLHRLYRPILEQSFEPPACLPRPPGRPLPGFIVTSTASAEMIKYASNAFLAAKISFINEIGGLCERVGADVVEVARGMGLDTRIGPGFLQAGIGWGGSCFPKDTQALLSMGADHDYTMPIVQAAVEVNRRQRVAIVEKLQAVLGGLGGRTVCLLGLAFKSGTDDVRESPAIELAMLLLERGAMVRAHDPVALDAFRRDYATLDVRLAASPADAARGADAIVLVTEWPDYRQLDWPALAAQTGCRVVVDGRNYLDAAALHGAGIVVIRLGQ